MARIQSIKRARGSKYPRPCWMCRDEIQVGDPYRKIEKKTGPTSKQVLNFCKKSECAPRTSHTLSGRSQQLAEIQEAYEDGTRDEAGDDPAVVAEVLSTMADSIRELAEEIEEAGQAIEDGFGNSTMQSEAMAETAQELSQWADDLADLASLVPELNEGDIDDDDEVENWMTEVESKLAETPELNLTG